MKIAIIGAGLGGLTYGALAAREQTRIRASSREISFFIKNPPSIKMSELYLVASLLMMTV